MQENREFHGVVDGILLIDRNSWGYFDFSCIRAYLQMESFACKAIGRLRKAS